MFYGILAVLFVIVCVVFYLADKEDRTIPVIIAKFTDSCFSGIGAGIVTYILAHYITSLFN